MALLFVDSFDHYAAGDITEKWTTLHASASVEIDASYGRNGTAGLRCNHINDQVVKGVTAASTLIAGCAVYVQAMTGQTLILGIVDGSTVQCQVFLNTDGSIGVSRNIGTSELNPTVQAVLGTSAADVWSTQTWFYLELKATLHSSTGAAVVRVNGVTVLTVTGADTASTANNSGSGVILGTYGDTPDVYFDDVYVANTSGTSNADFVGDCRIACLLPDADGALTDWVPSTGSPDDHYPTVDEAAPNDATDYISAASTAQRDSFSFESITDAGYAVKGVQLSVSAKKADAGARTITPFARVGSTNYDGTSSAPTDGGFTYATHVWDVNPATTTDWTVAIVNGAEFGVQAD